MYYGCKEKKKIFGLISAAFCRKIKGSHSDLLHGFLWHHQEVEIWHAFNENIIAWYKKKNNKSLLIK